MKGLLFNKHMRSTLMVPPKPLISFSKERVLVDFLRMGKVVYAVNSRKGGRCPFTTLERIEHFNDIGARNSCIKNLAKLEKNGLLGRILSFLEVLKEELPTPQLKDIVRWK